jgi:hypothetical protein
MNQPARLRLLTQASDDDPVFGAELLLPLPSAYNVEDLARAITRENALELLDVLAETHYQFGERNTCRNGGVLTAFVVDGFQFDHADGVRRSGPLPVIGSNSLALHGVVQQWVDDPQPKSAESVITRRPNWKVAREAIPVTRWIDLLNQPKTDGDIELPWTNREFLALWRAAEAHLRMYGFTAHPDTVKFIVAEALRSSVPDYKLPEALAGARPRRGVLVESLLFSPSTVFLPRTCELADALSDEERANLLYFSYFDPDAHSFVHTRITGVGLWSGGDATLRCVAKVADQHAAFWKRACPFRSEDGTEEGYKTIFPTTSNVGRPSAPSNAHDDTAACFRREIQFDELVRRDIERNKAHNKKIEACQCAGNHKSIDHDAVAAAARKRLWRMNQRSSGQQ